MKFKDLIFPLSLAFLLTWGIKYWYFGDSKTSGDQGEVVSGQSFVAPKTRQEIRPLNKEIDFIDEKRLHPRVLTEFETNLAKYTFSSDGASLERLEYTGASNGKLRGLGTVFPVSDAEKENKCLLLAFDEKTPYYYSFVDKQENDLEVVLRYRYDSPKSDVSVDKTFTVYKNTYKIDLKIEVSPKKVLEKGVEPRLFFGAPVMPDLGKDDLVSAVGVNERGSVTKTARASLDENVGRLKPKLFGTDSKYFVNAMISDPDQFVQRAYYKLLGDAKLFSILEGPTVDKKQAWSVSFYFGPKKQEALAIVDARLEKTLGYAGWLDFISKYLLLILKFFDKYLKNYGLAIILLTLLLRLLMLPFTLKMESGMKKRKELQKKLEYIQRKYKHDKATLAQERAELMRKHGMTGLGGCLPLLLQIPIFIALANVLRSSIELYREPFLWITDLSAKDPYYIFPALMSLGMLINAFTVDPKQRFMFIAMGLVIGPLCSGMSAGLGLYIVSSVGIGLLQSFVVKKFKSA